MKERPSMFVFSLQSNKRSCDLTASSTPQPHDHVWRRPAEGSCVTVAFAVTVAFVISTQSVSVGARALPLHWARSGDDFSREVAEVSLRAAGPGRPAVRLRMTAEQCCHTPGAVFGNTEAARKHGMRRGMGDGGGTNGSR